MTAPAAKVKVPGVGPTDKRIVIGGALAGIAVGGYAYYKKRQADSVAAVPSSAIDPATGLPYGSAEDATALTSQGGYVQPDLGTSGGPSDTPPAPQTPGFTSNAQWTQTAQAYLVDNGGGDAAIIGAALGKYISGQPCTEAQKTIVEQAIAAEGYPPVSGTTGYPPSIRDAAPLPVPVNITQLHTPTIRVKTRNSKWTVLVWSVVPDASFYWLGGSRILSKSVGGAHQWTVPKGSGTYHIVAYPKGYSQKTGYADGSPRTHTPSAPSASITA